MARGRSVGRAMGAVVAVLFVLGVGAATIRSTGAASPPTMMVAGRAGLGSDDASAGAPGLPVGPATAAAPAPAVPTPPVPAAVVSAGEVVVAPAPDRFDAPATPPAAPPAELARSLRLDASTAGTGTGTWAVIIGINDYPGSARDLRSAVNDADDVDLALAGMGVPDDQRLVLRDGQATAGRIGEALEWLVSRTSPDATPVLFFAGHVRQVGATTEALVAADGGLMRDSELADRLAPLAARRAWIAIAGCYGGGFTEVLRPGRILTGASPAGVLAWENPEFGRSYLVQYMVREAMIEHRAPESVQAAFAYAAAALAREHPDRQPVQFDQAGGTIDLHPEPLPPPPGPPAPVGVPAGTPPPTAPCRQLLIFACRA